nr:fetuin-B-like [Oncorhynchus nerka]
MGKCTWIFLLTHILLAWGQMIELSPTPCNDKAVEKLSKLALTYINEDRTEGYKFALNRISNVHLHAQGPAGNVYYLRLDVLETKCHVRSSKPWKRCDVRPFMETKRTYLILYSYDCTLVPDPPEKLQQICPACPLLLPIDSPRAVHAAGLTLYKFNTQSTLPSSLALQNLTRASVQNGPVPATFVEYTVQECREGYVGMCVPTDNSGDPAGFCKGAVYGAIGQPDVDVSCEIFHPQVLSIRLQYLCLFQLGLFAYLFSSGNEKEHLSQEP